MTVKDVIDITYQGFGKPVEFELGFDEYDPPIWIKSDDAVKIKAYGNFKVEKIYPMGDNKLALHIAIAPREPIVEKD